MIVSKTVQSLNNLISLYGGGTPSKDNNDYWDGAIPWASVKDLKSDILYKTQDSITLAGLENSASKIVKSGSLIIATRMAVGKVVIAELDVAINQDLKAIICHSDIDVKYLFYYLRTQVNYFNRVSSGATVKGIKINHILDMKIPVLPLTEQKKIAAILDAADSLRQKDQRLIDHYTRLSQSLFLEMFGDPISNPKGWDTKTIENLVVKKKGAIKRGPFGGALKKEIFVDKGYLVYEQYHALNNDFTMERYFIDKDKYEELKGFSVEPNDILISCSGVNLGRLAIVPENSKKGIINQALLKITLDLNLMSNVLFTYIFTNNNFKNTFIGEQRGSGVPNFPPMNVFKKFEFICPPIEIQNKFAQRIQAIESQKLQAQASLEKSNDLFNSLLQRAFKGELTQ